MTKSRPALRLALLVCLASLPACFIRNTSVGVPLPSSYERLQVGVTTKAEALTLMGAPDAALRQSDGDLYLYNRSHDYSSRLQLIPFVTFYERTDGQIHTDRLALIFDDTGILRGVGLEKEIPVSEPAGSR